MLRIFRQESGAVTGNTLPVTDALPAKRLIEVLSPADNAQFHCADKIVFSVAQAAGSDKIDSVQLWVGGSRKSTLFHCLHRWSLLLPAYPEGWR